MHHRNRKAAHHAADQRRIDAMGKLLPSSRYSISAAIEGVINSMVVQGFAAIS
jgi:hypothetical protein